MDSAYTHLAAVKQIELSAKCNLIASNWILSFGDDVFRAVGITEDYIALWKKFEKKSLQKFKMRDSRAIAPDCRTTFLDLSSFAKRRKSRAKSWYHRRSWQSRNVVRSSSIVTVARCRAIIVDRDSRAMSWDHRRSLQSRDVVRSSLIVTVAWCREIIIDRYSRAMSWDHRRSWQSRGVVRSSSIVTVARCREIIVDRYSRAMSIDHHWSWQSRGVVRSSSIVTDARCLEIIVDRDSRATSWVHSRDHSVYSTIQQKSWKVEKCCWTVARQLT